MTDIKPTEPCIGCADPKMWSKPDANGYHHVGRWTKCPHWQPESPVTGAIQRTDTSLALYLISRFGEGIEAVREALRIGRMAHEKGNADGTPTP